MMLVGGLIGWLPSSSSLRRLQQQENRTLAAALVKNADLENHIAVGVGGDSCPPTFMSTNHFGGVPTMNCHCHL